MSEKENKKNKKAAEAAESAAKEAAPEAAESAAEAAGTTEDTYTVTKAQIPEADRAREGAPVQRREDRHHQAVSGGAGQSGTGREPI